MALRARPSDLVQPGQPPPAGAPRATPMQVSYRDPDGVLWPWSDIGMGTIVTGVTGIGSAATTAQILQMDSGDTLVQAVAPASRSIVVGLYVFDDDQDKLLDRVDALADALAGERAGTPAPGTLILARPRGTARQIPVLCTSGPEQAEDDGTRDAYKRWTQYGLTFLPLSAYWESADPITVTWQAPPGSAGVPPMPPVLLSSGATLGESELTNAGRAEAYGVWTLTGPGTPHVENVTLGHAWDFAPLDAGEVITVDTRSGRVSAIDSTGADRWADLVESSPRDLWPLAVGLNKLNVAMADPTEDSKITFTYWPRWRRA